MKEPTVCHKDILFHTLGKKERVHAIPEEMLPRARRAAPMLTILKKTHCNGARKVSLSGFVSPWFRTGRRHKSIPLTRIQNDRKAPLVTSKPSFKTHCLEYSPLAKSWSCIKHGKAEVLALHPPTTCAAPL